MDRLKLATVVGAGVTTLLVIGGGTIEALVAMTGADVGSGIVGVVAGVLAGVLATGVVAWRWASLGDRGRVLLVAYGTFGLAVLLIAAMGYVNVPGVDPSLGLRRTVGVAVVVSLVVAVAAWRRRAAGSGPT